ncbi:MAG: septum formation initiator family protein [Candidatus Shapirobacteria bacterium]|jgi:hypothetical protein
MKKIFLIFLGLVISGSIIGNIKTQYSTLKEAEKQNLKIEKEISKFNQENQILNQKVEYATSSAFLEQEARDKLALGNESDVWLDLGEEKNINLFPKVNETKKIAKIKQWISLFTR